MYVPSHSFFAIKIDFSSKETPPYSSDMQTRVSFRWILSSGISSIFGIHSCEPPQFVDLSGALIGTWARPNLPRSPLPPHFTLVGHMAVRLQISKSPTTAHHFQMPLKTDKPFSLFQTSYPPLKRSFCKEGIRQIEGKTGALCRCCVSTIPEFFGGKPLESNNKTPDPMVSLIEPSCQSSPPPHRLEWWRTLENNAAEYKIKHT